MSDNGMILFLAKSTLLQPSCPVVEVNRNYFSFGQETFPDD